jgi:hypothetical protein
VCEALSRRDNVEPLQSVRARRFTAEKVTACDEQSDRFDESDAEVFREECRAGNNDACENLTNDDLVLLCSEGFPAACTELDSRTGE